MSSILEFKEIELQDKAWADSLLALSDYRATEYCFTTLYTWAPMYGTRIARRDNLLFIRSEREDTLHYIYPAGKGDVAQMLEWIDADAAACGKPYVMFVISPVKEALEKDFPDRFTFTPIRDSFDYIYSAESMITLSGKKYQPKRNFISRFKTLNPDWVYERIDPSADSCDRLLQECLDMTDEWCAANGCIHDESMSKEACAVRRGLQDFRALDLRGGLLRCRGKVVAYTFGEKVNSDTLIVHAEKAFHEVTGAYQAINRMFLEHEAQGLTYINREDDAGDEGLRKAKLSYHPCFMLEKYLAVSR